MHKITFSVNPVKVVYSMITDVQQIVVLKDRSKEDDFGNAYKMLSK